MIQHYHRHLKLHHKLKLTTSYNKPEVIVPEIGRIGEAMMNNARSKYRQLSTNNLTREITRINAHFYLKLLCGVRVDQALVVLC